VLQLIANCDHSVFCIVYEIVAYLCFQKIIRYHLIPLLKMLFVLFSAFKVICARAGVSPEDESSPEEIDDSITDTPVSIMDFRGAIIIGRRIIVDIFLKTEVSSSLYIYGSTGPITVFPYLYYMLKNSATNKFVDCTN